MVLIGAIVVVLAVLAAAAFLFLNARNQEGDEVQASSAEVLVPTFLPLDNMVVNLADPGGDRFVQIGITLELQDDKTAKVVKQYLPSIRNGVLMLVSQRSSEELLAREGKEKLAADIRDEVSRPLGLGAAPAARAASDDGADETQRPRRRESAVRRVLFSSFIIQ
ncbi:flagellar basal body-associated FliL family protein [Acidovorax sp. Be4]|uniref:Flagellar protein FliL n=1 Tax=Acidovorax bellezanensis TaxID=2976702 RepID=A0ABT2PQT1_9BURK|nr:flagellar basal body-associated FliL family protein [Acidovorax sp. Be4]MCT9812630.1 flagellar basal body-associated FliL family protein [Acidovorax sp. Be4]